MQADELSDIYLAGLLHDVGKIGVRDAVLAKTEPLTPQEFDHIKQHVNIGLRDPVGTAADPEPAAGRALSPRAR